jgi:hypothetical protein
LPISLSRPEAFGAANVQSMMLRRFLSVVIVVLFGLPGVLVFAFGAGLSVSYPHPDPFTVVGTIVSMVIGGAMIVLTMFSVRLSSIGVVLHGTTLGVLALVAFVSTLTNNSLGRSLFSQWPDGASMVEVLQASGVLVVLGIVFFVGGLAVRSRPLRPASSAGTIAAGINAVLCGVAVVPLLVYSVGAVNGATSRLLFWSMRSNPVVFSYLGPFVLAAILLVVVCATLRWTSIGAAAWGVCTVIAAMLFAVPSIGLPVRDLGFVWHDGVSYVVDTGVALMLGMTVLAAAAASTLRTRAGRKKQLTDSAVAQHDHVLEETSKRGDHPLAQPQPATSV